VLPPKAAERVADSKSFRHDDAGRRRLRDMDMAVDAAGQHQHPAGVDDLGAVPKSAPSAVTLPPLIPTSQENVSEAVATVPRG